MKEQKEPENNRNDKEVKTLNFKELQERAKGRNFDQITVVSRDIFQELANLSLVFPVAPGKVRTETEQNHPGLTVGKQEITYTQMCTTIYYQNTSLQVVQPVEGDTIYQRYLDRFGEGTWRRPRMLSSPAALRGVRFTALISVQISASLLWMVR